MTRVAYLDCGSGISGDMTLAALVDAGVELDVLNLALGSLGVPGLRLRATEVKKASARPKSRWKPSRNTAIAVCAIFWPSSTGGS